MGLFRRRQVPTMSPGEDNENPMYNVSLGTVQRAYPGSFAGAAGSQVEHLEADRTQGRWWTEAELGVRDDPSYGGVPGDVDTLPYSLGPVNPNDVEDFSLMGNVSKSFRRRSESNPGPVSVLDYRSQLAMQIVQSMTPDVYDEASQLSVIGGF